MKMKEMKLLLWQSFNNTLCSEIYLFGNPHSYF